jgi:hypothetical protein
MWEEGLKNVIYNWLAIVIYTLAILFLYFCIGRRFLCNTHSVLTNALSVTVLFIIIIVSTSVAYESFFERLFRVPVYPLGGTIFYFFQIKEKYVFLVMSILPSITMWVGMVTKR